MTTIQTRAYRHKETGLWLHKKPAPASMFPDGLFHYTDDLNEAYTEDAPPDYLRGILIAVPVRVTRKVVVISEGD